MKKRKKLGKPKDEKMQTTRLLTEPDNKLVGEKALGKPPLGLAISKEIKQGLLHQFRTSRGMGILKAFLDYRLPYLWLAYYEKTNVISVSPEGEFTVLDEKRFLELLNRLDKNFKWVFEQLVKMMPKDMASFGSLKDDQTLTGIVRKVTIQAKSKKTREIIDNRREEEVLEYKQTEEITKYETC